MTKNRIFITCGRGCDEFVAQEVSALGLPLLGRSISGIETEGSMADAMELNLCLRTGIRVLFLVAEFKAIDPNSLYRKIASIPWEQIIADNEFFSITATVDNPTINNSNFVSQKVKDAVADRFIKMTGRRPDSGPDKTAAVFHIHWQDDHCSVYIDTSGEPLAKRGYRKMPYKAPLQETLAASLIMASKWKGGSNFINPMCGSGTLAIEAALIGIDRTPGLLRSNFGFMHIKGFDEQKWNEIRRRAKEKSKKALDFRIVATDISAEAIDISKKNAMTAGVDHLIEFRQCGFEDTEIPEGGGVVLMNPEYGERMGKIAELEKVYEGIGNFLKKKCAGYNAYVFTGNPALAKKIGLRSKRKIIFFNGPIECRLLEYELYKGSRNKD